MSAQSRNQAAPPMRLALAWYHPNQWQLLREKSIDKETLEDTYEEWLHVANEKAEDLISKGYVLKKVLIDVNEWASWCMVKHLPLDGASRAHYAAHLSATANENHDKA